jgi:mRNA-degrading endonuclease HigB of HigAB toxin-antitoxin module
MRKEKLIRLFTLASALFLFSAPAYSQNALGVGGGMQGFLYGVIAFVLLAIFAVVYLLMQSSKYQRQANIAAGKPDAPTGLSKWWSELDKKYFTKAASLEKQTYCLIMTMMASKNWIMHYHPGGNGDFILHWYWEFGTCCASMFGKLALHHCRNMTKR